MSTSTLSWPRGVSFALLASIPARYPDAVFSGYTPQAQLRRTNGTLIADLQAQWLDASTTRDLKISCQDTSTWPVGTHMFDVRLIGPSGAIAGSYASYLSVTQNATEVI